MSHLRFVFNSSCPKSSPVLPEYRRVVKRDDEKEFVIFETFDVSDYAASNGVAADWNLNVLLKAGINPDFPIHTGLSSRIEGQSSIDVFSKLADDVLNEKENEN